MKRTLCFVGLALCVTGFSAGHAAARDCVEPPLGFDSWWPGPGNADDIHGSNDGALVKAEIQAIFDAGKCDKSPPPRTIEELLRRIEALEDLSHT